MKRKYFTFLPLILLTACNKDNKKQYSTWYVNGQEFKSNNVKKDIGNSASLINCYDEINRFTIGFIIPLPTFGTYPLLIGTYAHPDSVNINFYYNNNFYIPYHNGELKIIGNKKFKAELSPAWFKNYDDPFDTVLISGTFNEP